MQVDFSKLEQLVGEYYYVSNLMLIPGQVMDLREADFTDFYIYAIKQGYDPRTFQPIDVAEAENIQNYINGRIQTYEMYRQKQKVIGSLTLDLIPVIGQVKSAIELATGENLVTGEELNGWDYGFGNAGAIAPAIKGGRGLYKGYKALTAVDDAVDVGRVLEDAVDLPNLINAIEEAGSVTDAVQIVKYAKISKWPDADVYELISTTFKKADWSEDNIALLQRTVAEESGWIGKYYDEDMKILWPGMNGDPNIDGFLNGISNPEVLQAGFRIDRYGHPGGAFLSPEETSYAARALKPGTKETSNYYVYEVLKPIDVKAGEIAPWFGQPGGGVQYYLGKGKSIQQLVDDGYLKVVKEVVN